MPKETRIKKSKRQAIRQQDVFEFGQKIQPAARPVDYDTSVRAQNVSGGGAQALLDGLGLAGDLTKNFGEAKKVMEAEHTAAGKLAGQRGEVLNADATEAFIKGHEMATGMGAVANFNNLMVKKHQELLANESTPAEYEREMKLEERKFLASGSDAYTEGAVRGGALETQKNLSVQFAKAQFKRLQAKGLYNINGIIDGKFAEIAAMPSETTKDRLIQAIAARNVMTSMQQLGMSQYNLDRNQVNNSVIKHLAPIAQAQANPELFAFAFVDDGTGNKIVNTEHGADVYAAMEVADNQRQANIKTATKNQEKADKLRVEDAQRNMSMAFASAKQEDIVAASQQLLSLRDILPPTVLDAYIKDVQDFASGFGYAEVTDMEAYHGMKEQAVTGELSYALLSGNKSVLEPTHFKEVLDKMIAFKEKERTRAAGKADPRVNEIDRSRSALKPILDKEDKFGKREEPLAGPTRASYGSKYFDSIMEMWKNNEVKGLPNKEKRQFPNFKERIWIEEKVLFESYKAHPPTGMSKNRINYTDPESGAVSNDPTVGPVNWDDDKVDNIH